MLQDLINRSILWLQKKSEAVVNPHIEMFRESNFNKSLAADVEGAISGVANFGAEKVADFAHQMDSGKSNQEILDDLNRWADRMDDMIEESMEALVKTSETIVPNLADNLADAANYVTDFANEAIFEEPIPRDKFENNWFTKSNNSNLMDDIFDGKPSPLIKKGCV